MSSFSDIVQGPASPAGVPSKAPVATGFSSIVEAPTTQSVAAVKTAQQAPPTPPPAPAPAPQQNFFQKTASAIGTGVSDVWNKLVNPTPKPAPSGPMTFNVGEGLNADQTANANKTLSNVADQSSNLDQTTMKLPFIDKGITMDNGADNGLFEGALKSVVEAPEKIVRSLASLATEATGKTPDGTNRENTHAFFTPSYAEVAGKNTGDLLDELQAQGMDVNSAKSAAVVLGSASAAGSFANDALVYLDPLAGENGALKSTVLDDALTKNLVTTTTPESVRYFNTNEVKDIWQTGKLLTDEEKQQVIQVLGGGANKSAAIQDAFKNGISIKVPESSITTLEDKPYWSKIKQYFGAEPSTPKLIASDVKTPVQTVRGYLQEGGVVHPDDLHQPDETPYSVNKAEINNPDSPHMVAVKEETASMLHEGHSVEEVSAQLQKELGMPKGVADTIIHEVSSESMANLSEGPKDLPAETSVPTNSLQSKAALTSDYQPARAASIASVYKNAGPGIDGGNYFQGTYDGKPYTTNTHILEFNNDLSDVKGLKEIKDTPAPTEAMIHRIIPDGGVKLSADNVKTTGTTEYVNLKNKDLDIHVDRKYFDYMKKKYPDADFVGTHPQKAIKVIEDGKLKGLLMPNSIDLSKAPQSWNKSHSEGLSAEQTPIKAPENIPKVEDAQERGPVTLNSSLIPGLDKFIADDIVPRSKGLLQTTKNVYSELVHTFDPVGSSPSKAVDILFKEKGNFQKFMFNLEQATKEIKTMWNKQPETARMEFMSNIEAGNREFAASRGFGDIYDMYKTRLDNSYKAIEEFKDLPFLENFFPHFWEKPGDITSDVMKKMAAKNPLQGTRSFLKQRVFSTIEEGIKAGYTPISTNPEELMQTYEANVRKFVMAQQIKEDMVANNFWKFVKHGEDVPAGFSKIDDAIANVYFPIKMESGSTVVSSLGTYYAQDDVARMINNYLSKNKILDTALGRGLMNTKNMMNAFQLGFSAFHIQAEIINSIVSKVGVGIGQLTTGNVLGALKSFATAPLAPLTYMNDGRKFFNGDPTMKLIEDSLFTGGADLREKQYYKNGAYDTMIAKFQQGNYIGAALRAPMGIIEATMRPIFHYMIPRMKIGAFRDLYSAELTRNASKIASGELTQETLARTTWRNIENRFGELNYDNLMWNQTFKGATMLAIRAPGWNVGTISEVGGAALDIPKQTWSAMTGNGFNMTPKMQYTLALFMVLGGMGAAYQYLHTGKGPSSVKDLYAPKNGGKNLQGDPERTVFASYLKDIYNYGTSPIQTVENKASPEFATIIALLNNKNYYGDFIRNPNDKTSLQAKQVSLYLASQFEPFSVAQFAQQKSDSHTTEEQQLESFLGFVNAPKAIIQSAYEKKLEEIYSEQRGAYGPRTPEQVAIQDAKNKATAAIRNGDLSLLKQLEQEGIITPRGAATFVRNATKTTAQKEYGQLNATRKAQARSGN